MIWRLNDSWPILYFAVVDYYLETKVAYDYLRRAYAPLLVCFERTPDSIAVWVVNDTSVSVAGRLHLRHRRFDGAQLGELSAEIALAPGEARRCLDATPLGVINLRKENSGGALQRPDGDMSPDSRALSASTTGDAQRRCPR